MSDTPEQAAMFGDWGPIHRPEDTASKPKATKAAGYNWRSLGRYLPKSDYRHLAKKYANQQKANKAAKKARKRNRGR